MSICGFSLPERFPLWPGRGCAGIDRFSREKKWAVLLSVLILLVLPRLSWGENLGRGEAVRLDADQISFDRERNLYVAEGAVHLVGEELDMTCDYAEYSDLTGDVSAEGNVVLQDGDKTLQCERARWNVRTRLGNCLAAAMDNLKRGYLLKGERIDKVGEEEYRVKRGSLSECGKKRPLWEIRGERLSIKPRGYVTSREATLRIASIPVLYSPYFFYPLGDTRSSGFLPPVFGQGGRNGSSMELDYFWALDTDRDATFSYEYLGDNGNRFGLEYRYAVTRDIRGSLFGRYIHDRNADRDGSRIGMNEDRWEIGATHLYNMRDRLYGGLFLDVFSDGNYLGDFSRSSEARVRNNGQSDLTLTRRWDGGDLNLDFRYYQELGVRRRVTTLQRFPEVRLDLTQARIGDSNWFYSLESGFVNFYRRENYTSTFSSTISSDPLVLNPVTPVQNENLDRLREAGFDPDIALRYQGIQGRRFDFSPNLSLPIDLAPWLIATPSIGYRETLYSRSALGEDFVERGVLRAGFDLAARLYHDFGVGARKRIRHILEPRLTYAYRPRQGQKRIPIYDGIDRIDPEDAIHLKLVNRLILTTVPGESPDGEEGGKFPERREVVTLKLDALYDRIKDQGTWRDIQGELDLNLMDGLYLETKGSYDFLADDFGSLNVDLTLHQGESLSFQLGRRYTRTIPLDPNRPTGSGLVRAIGGNDVITGLTNEGISYWTAHLNWNPVKPLTLSLSGYFNAKETTGNEESFRMAYETRCWGISLSLDRYDDAVLNDHTQQLEIDRVNEIHVFFTIKSLRIKVH